MDTSRTSEEGSLDQSVEILLTDSLHRGWKTYGHVATSFLFLVSLALVAASVFVMQSIGMFIVCVALALMAFAVWWVAHEKPAKLLVHRDGEHFSFTPASVTSGKETVHSIRDFSYLVIVQHDMEDGGLASHDMTVLWLESDDKQQQILLQSGDREPIEALANQISELLPYPIVHR